MKLLIKIDGVDKFIASKFLAYSSNNNLYLFDGDAARKVGAIPAMDAFNIVGDNLYFQEQAPGNILKIEPSFVDPIKINASVFICGCVNAGSHIACIRREESNSYLDFISKTHDEVESTYLLPSGIIGHYFNEGFVFFTRKKIFCTDRTIQKKWENDLNPNERVKGPMHTWGDILIYCTQITDDRFAPRYVQACSLSTGELLWREEGYNYYQQDPVTGMLYALSGALSCVDPKKGVTKHIYNTLDKDKGLYIYEHLVHYSDGILYFSTSSDPNNPVHIGGYNVHTNKFEFLQPLDVPATGAISAGKPIVKNGKLYVLDSQKTLHIYAL